MAAAGFGLSFSVKNAFFDLPEIERAIGRARVKVLSKAGAFIRQRARSSIRPPRGLAIADMRDDERKAYKSARAIAKAKGRKAPRRPRASSKPGEPPRSQTGILRRFIFFAYDKAADSVVIGPAATNQVFFNKDRRPVTGTVPSVLEYGGQITILEVLVAGTWRRADLRSRRRLAQRKTRYRTVEIAARPYMGPALEAEQEHFVELWRDSIGRAA